MDGTDRMLSILVLCATIIVLVIAVLCAKDCSHTDEMRARCVDHGSAPESCRQLYKTGGS